MQVIAVDDEELLLEGYMEQLREMEEIDGAEGFTKEADALEYVRHHRVDVALLDIEMTGMGGIALAGKMAEAQPDINIIFVTGYDEYGLEAMKLHASGYLLKPLTVRAIRKEFAHLRYPAKQQQPGKRIYVNTFGNFDVFLEGKPVVFHWQRSKEVLAYLVQRRGETVTRRELAAILFDGREYDRKQQKLLQRVLDELRGTLEQYDMMDILIRGNNSLSIDRTVFDCDLYEFLEGKQGAAEKFHGFYLENYSWGEEMKGLLTEMKTQKNL